MTLAVLAFLLVGHQFARTHIHIPRSKVLLHDPVSFERESIEARRLWFVDRLQAGPPQTRRGRSHRDALKRLFAFGALGTDA